MKRLILSCTLALLPALANAGLDEGVAAYSAGDYATALKEFRELADQGNPDGQYFLGFLYHNGFGVKASQTEALKWFEKAAEQGDGRSQYYAGIIYATGKGGVARDLSMADMWLTLSATNPKTPYRDTLYTKEEIKKLEKKMTPDQLAKAKDLIKGRTQQN